MPMQVRHPPRDLPLSLPAQSIPHCQLAFHHPTPGEEPLPTSQRQHLGRSAKSTAQRKLHERDSDAELDEVSASVDDGDARSASVDEKDGSTDSGSPLQNGNALPARGKASQVRTPT